MYNSNSFTASEYFDYSDTNKYLTNKKKQMNVVKCTVEIADGTFKGFRRIIELDSEMFDCNCSEASKSSSLNLLNTYLCNQLYHKLMFFFNNEQMTCQVVELNNIKNKMTIDEDFLKDKKELIIDDDFFYIYVKT